MPKRFSVPTKDYADGLLSASMIVIRRVQRRDDDPIHRRFNVSALRVLRVVWQLPQGLDGLGSREDGHPIPRLLTLPNRLVPRAPNWGDREFSVGRFQFLQANDVRARLAHPVQKIGQALPDIVDVECCYLHLSETGIETRLP
jgi:hypothetical protein